jgi:uncharacterized protein YecA (UPF0149 family)
VNAARKPPPINPPPPEDDNTDALATAVAVIAGMQAEHDATKRELTSAEAIIAEFENERARQNWRVLAAKTAQAAKAAQLLVPLTMAADELVDLRPRNTYRARQKNNYEKIRAWCELGYVVAEKRGKAGNWVVEMNSLWAFAATKGIYPGRRPPKSKS